MPLKAGSSREIIAANIAELIRSGKEPNQAAAIAYQHAGIDQPKRYYSVASLSERISETPEGFLICESVPITRTGELVYAQGETPIEPGATGRTIITRTVEDIHDPATIASFEGKPVTINHPDDFVTPENWRELAVGVVQNVRPGEGDEADKLLADLLITDAEAISAVKSKQLREVSCGYEATYHEEAPGRGRQENIIGNHVALVAAGRCGSECAIFDHAAPQSERESMKDKLLKLFGKAIDEAMEDQSPQEAIAAIMERLAALEAKMGESTPDEKAPEEKASTPDAPDIEQRIAALEEAIMKLMGEEMEDKQTPVTADTIARAEVLCPGIAKTGDVKAKALDAFANTEEGAAILATLLNGKTIETADKDMLFVAASEMVKGSRRNQFVQSKVSLDALPTIKPGTMTPEKLNQINAAYYKR